MVLVSHWILLSSHAAMSCASLTLVGKAFAGIHTERFLESVGETFHRPVESDENRLRLDAVATEPSNDILVDIELAKGGFKSGLELARGSLCSVGERRKRSHNTTAYCVSGEWAAGEKGNAKEC